MKANFILNGLLYLSAQLLFISNTSPRLETTRTVAAWIYAIGIIFVALDSGNTGRAKGEKKFQFHGLGSFMAIVSGNVGSLLAGLAVGRGNAVYGWVSYVLGVGGLVAMGISARDREGRWRGLWQRSSIYPIPAWMGVTGMFLMMEGLG